MSYKIVMQVKKIEQIKVRFAPSPTGMFHIGSARAALFNYLFAKKNSGIFILRIEDTDKERSKPEFENDLIESLKWLGINWDESPYRQSERTEIYEKYIKKLFDENKVYYCFHSEEDLEKEKEIMLASGEAPRYRGYCRDLSKEEVNKKLERGEKHIIRFKMPKTKVVFKDLIRGKVTFDTALFDDLAIAKDLSSPLYNLAAVIDDHEMGITHVIRGEDHISNTPKQILIGEALGFDSPHYAHLPLILAPDHSKLSKRHGAIAVSDYKKMGYLPEAIINFIAFLGWNPGINQEVFSKGELEKEFSLERVGKSGAIFNVEKLNWLNSYYIRKLPLNDLTKMIKNFVNKDWLEIYKESDFQNIVGLFHDRLRKLSDFETMADLFFKEDLEYDSELLIWKDDPKEKTQSILKELKQVLDSLASKFSTGGVFWPFRVAISGKKASPDPLEIAVMLGKEKVLERLEKAIETLK